MVRKDSDSHSQTQKKPQSTQKPSQTIIKSARAQRPKAVPTEASGIPILGGMSAATFFREYWHKKPLLIRRAIPHFTPPVLPADLLELAKHEAVESREISLQRGQWQLHHGPFTEGVIPRKKDWTLLVQGVNLHNSSAAALLREFRFVPDTRLDDLMISYATDGGGVGPHFDSYDVFLLQAQGVRRWEIAAQDDLTLMEGLPLKILQNFTPQQSWELEPGDMLYLPPHIAHNGIAVGDCMTYSIGFRAPSNEELAEEFFSFILAGQAFNGRFQDRLRKPQNHPAELDDSWVEHMQHLLKQMQWKKQTISEYLGCFLSDPKPQVVFSAPEPFFSFPQFVARAQAQGLQLDQKTRMLYRKQQLFINGESYRMAGKEQRWLERLANQQFISAQDKLPSQDGFLHTLYDWYCAGWIKLLA